ncbi:peptide-methionine (S)-S-oxide reductase MsrA [Dyella mobilis]|uniref:Peptide methionine sulfoxide reductase MsrA n=1 Tax=Dyella mobilis TaxID=1849582 RepID=A0ABS2KJT6_9GAMM|nr:peptide-methionine (S)-S-oxide reductase MsrA [Dyella mobilis]MBM7131417.1 peptide-methionine (S)-S-oxide reductase MsrA [Dyella mobilis]GLQ96610.1 peptide methionine sulfoxide reductase MsrA [Dyella mobilis]
MKAPRLISVFAFASLAACTATAGNANLPEPSVDSPKTSEHGTETAVLAGGCFWGMQSVFEHVRGVRRVWAGYSGGDANTAHYDDVSEGDTGHAESVKIQFDPAVISYGELLKVYFAVAHDPTQLNRQGPDAGTQYRSEIFYATPDQQKIAQAYIAQLSAAKVFDSNIVTLVQPLKAFYPAESYHQDYALHHPDDAYIVINDAPKVAHLKQLYPGLYQPEQQVVEIKL